MKLISWNVNGIRAVMGKGFMDAFAALDADAFCLQQTKCQPDQIALDLPGYHQYWYSAQKKGYSGTAMFIRQQPLQVRYGIGVEEHDHEGRVIAAELDDYWLVTCYTPNAQDTLARLPYRVSWQEAFLHYLKQLEQTKPVILCGDLNVAHQEIDLKNPKSNKGHAGFTDEERNCMSALLDSGFIDTFRHFYPDVRDQYSWWSYRFHARENNAGWRIDYFLASRALESRLCSAGIHQEIYGSDHCPVELIVK